MNTPLEVMKAIVDNGGPVEAWVRDNTELQNWERQRIIAVFVEGNPFPFEDGRRNVWRLCSLTDPNANYVPIPTEWTHDWARYRAVDADGSLHEYEDKPYWVTTFWKVLTSVSQFKLVSIDHDPTSWQNSLEERPRKTRPMTPREAALFLHGQPYAVQLKIWVSWVPASAAVQLTDPEKWQYADLRDPDFPQWKDFPEVEDA